MKRRVGALLMALALVMTGFAAYAEDDNPEAAAVEDSVEDVTVSEEEPVEGESAANLEEIPEEVGEESLEVAEPEITFSEEDQNAEEVIFEPEDTAIEELQDEETEIETEEENIKSFWAQSGNLSVTVEAPIGALPDGAQLYIQSLDADSDEYEEVYSYVKEQEEGNEEASNVEIVDIYFTLDGEKVDPSEALTVKLGLTEYTNADRSSLKAWDYTNKVKGIFNTETQEVEFVTANLQTFACTWGNNDVGIPVTYATSYAGEDSSSNSKLSLEVIETSSPEDGEAYQKGEVLTYYIKVSNIGTEDLYNIVVKDSLSTKSWEIDYLPVDGDPYTTEEDETSYTVTSLDAKAGDINIEVEAFDASEPKTFRSNTEPMAYCIIIIICGECENSNPEISISVIEEGPKDGEAYRKGEELTYQIEITNTGDVDFSDVVVDDNLSDEHHWDIGSLSVEGDGNSYTTEGVTYTITEEDAKAGSLAIEISVSGEYASNSEKSGANSPYVNSYSETVITHLVPELTVTIETDRINEPKNGKAYQENEEIKYPVTVTNTGDYTITDIQVENYPADDSETWTISSLKPGGSKSKTISYTVSYYDTLKDTYNGVDPSITITAYAEGKYKYTEDGSEVEESVYSWDSFSDEKLEELSVDVEPGPQKYVDIHGETGDYNDDGQEVDVDDTLYYRITYKNSDTKTKQITITDELEEGLDIVKAEGAIIEDQKATWKLEVQPQDTVQVDITARVNDNAIWEVANAAYVDGVPTNDVYNPLKDKGPEGPRKSVDVGDGTSVSVGKELTYKIEYFNHHNYWETVTITDELDKGLTYNSASPGGTYDSETRTITWEVEDVDPFSYGEVTFTATVNGSTVTTTSYEEDVDVDEEDDEGNEEEDKVSYVETKSTGKVENTAYVKIGDDEKEPTGTVTNYISTTSGSGSGSGSDGESSKKNTAVNTADDTPAATMLALFGAAFVALGADMIYRRRRTQR